jgi:hypothetical protein
VTPANASLVATPGSLAAAMLVGSQRTVELVVSNQGSAASGPLICLLPSAPWLSLATPPQIASIASGATSSILVTLTPATSIALGPYTGTIVVQGTNGNLNVPFSFTAVSDRMASLSVTSEDEYTFFAAGTPNLTNATVSLSDASTGAVVTNGVTDQTGQLIITNIVEGPYNLTVSAAGHTTFSTPILLTADQPYNVVAFLSIQSVSYTWSVTPTQVLDTYLFTLETTFLTDVPIPVVTVDPADIDLSQFTNEISYTNFTISNHGLIAAQAVTLSFGSSSAWNIMTVGTNLGVLPAESSFSVPVTFQRLSPTAQVAKASLQVKANGRGIRKNDDSDDSDDCNPLSGTVDYQYQCGGTRQTDVPISLRADDTCSPPSSGGNVNNGGSSGSDGGGGDGGGPVNGSSSGGDNGPGGVTSVPPVLWVTCSTPGDNNNGDNNNGNNNNGNDNDGNNNVGNNNVGNNNVGNNNVGNNNDGNDNDGDCNIGDHNIGDHNDGDHNDGDCNTGDNDDGDHDNGSNDNGSNDNGSNDNGSNINGNNNGQPASIQIISVSTPRTWASDSTKYTFLTTDPITATAVPSGPSDAIIQWTVIGKSGCPPNATWVLQSQAQTVLFTADSDLITPGLGQYNYYRQITFTSGCMVPNPPIEFDLEADLIDPSSGEILAYSLLSGEDGVGCLKQDETDTLRQEYVDYRETFGQSPPGQIVKGTFNPPVPKVDDVKTTLPDLPFNVTILPNAALLGVMGRNGGKYTPAKAIANWPSIASQAYLDTGAGSILSRLAAGFSPQIYLSSAYRNPQRQSAQAINPANVARDSSHQYGSAIDVQPYSISVQTDPFARARLWLQLYNAARGSGALRILFEPAAGGETPFAIFHAFSAGGFPDFDPHNTGLPDPNITFKSTPSKLDPIALYVNAYAYFQFSLGVIHLDNKLTP